MTVGNYKILNFGNNNRREKGFGFLDFWAKYHSGKAANTVYIIICYQIFYSE